MRYVMLLIEIVKTGSRVYYNYAARVESVLPNKATHVGAWCIGMPFYKIFGSGTSKEPRLLRMGVSILDFNI